MEKFIIQSDKSIPDNEMWLYNKNNNEIINKAIKWAETNERRENFEEIARFCEDF
ncbi:MAG TPA: hypothetical protein LFW21_03045 [Rickettsia endosymbiont of Pyrocoelia pectoralis]|nr:hypothetical protein [Rickettsia endosymbiont of Pyrocoelia pectoralis]